MHSRNLRIFLLKNIQVFFGCLDSHIKEKTKTLKKNHIVQAHSPSNRQVSKKYRKNIRSLHFQQRDPRQCSKSGFPLHHLLSRPLLSSLGRGEKQVNGSSDSGSFFPPLTKEQLQQRVGSGRHHFCFRTAIGTCLYSTNTACT